MSTLDKVLLEADDTAAAEIFYKSLGVDQYVEVRPVTGASSGFRGFTLSLVCAQPGNVDAVIEAALAAGATAIKPAAKSFWGYGGVIEAPDGAIWSVAASSKKDSAPAVPEFDDLVLLLGVNDVRATKKFYTDRGLTVGKSFGGKYVELETAPVKLALYPRKAAAKNAGVPVDGSGSHRIAISGDGDAFTDPDGFVWVCR